MIEIYRKIDGEIKRFCTLANVQSYNYTAALNDRGEFSLTIPLSAAFANGIKINDFIRINDFWGAVTGIKKTANGDGTTAEISGVDLAFFILSKRIIIPPTYTDGSVGYTIYRDMPTERVIKSFVSDCLTSSTNTARNIADIVVAAEHSPAIGIDNDGYAAKGNNLFDVVSELSKCAGIGFKFSLQNVDTVNKFVFDVFSGLDRTENQTTNARAVFVVERGNVLSVDFAEDFSNFKNTFYTFRSGTELMDDTITMTYFRDDEAASGWERSETWLEVSAETPEEGAELEELKYQATKAMTEYIADSSLVGELAPDSSYKNTWNIGDTVTLRWKDCNIAVDTQITAVTVSATGSELSISAKFGDAKPRYIGLNSQDKIIKI